MELQLSEKHIKHVGSKELRNLGKTFSWIVTNLDLSLLQKSTQFGDDFL